MRRRILAASLAALALVGCAQVRPGAGPAASGPPGSAGPPASPAPTVTCADLAAGLTLRQQAGQLVMMGVTGDLDAAEERLLGDGGFGSVILMGNTTDGLAATRERVRAIQSAGGGQLLVAVDQEGGAVQRLRGEGFDRIPPASEQATLTPTELAGAAARWGGQLRDAGVHLDLAPVADVVPADKVATNEPIGKLGRGFGSDPDAVGERVVAVLTGLRAAGVAASPKHFPNLGQVVGNTDFAADVVDDVTTADDPALAPYRRAVAEGVDTIMVATARYTRIDPSAPAAFSPRVVSILRDDVGFAGVVVSDDLGVAKAVADVPAGERGVRFVRAGGDLAISVDAEAAAAMVAGLVAGADADPALRTRVGESAQRVLDLKGRLGVSPCQPVVG